jgi:hypothetical protein
MQWNDVARNLLTWLVGLYYASTLPIDTKEFNLIVLIAAISFSPGTQVHPTEEVERLRLVQSVA